LAGLISSQDDIVVLEEKDYIKNLKPKITLAVTVPGRPVVSSRGEKSSGERRLTGIGKERERIAVSGKGEECSGSGQ